MVEQRFIGKTWNLEACRKMGFVFENDCGVYRTLLDGVGFELIVSLQNEELSTQVLDEFGEEYFLHHVTSAQGSFVGRVREAVEACLDEIENKCCQRQLYQKQITVALIHYIKETYGDDLEYLWKNSTNAIWRRKDTQTWYAACLVVSQRKLGLASDSNCEVINVRVQPEKLEALLKEENIYPAYHMNKKHWVSIILDDTMDFHWLCQMVDTSFQLTVK